MHGSSDPSADAPGSWLALARSRAVVRRALAYAVVVGSILVAINHGDALLRGELTRARGLRILLTVTVPYLVSTLSSVGALRQAGRQARGQERPAGPADGSRSSPTSGGTFP